MNQCCKKCISIGGVSFCPDCPHEHCLNPNCPCHEPSKEEKVFEVDGVLGEMIGKYSESTPQPTTSEDSWEVGFRNKWEGANTGGHNAISTPVMDELISDISTLLSQSRSSLLEELRGKVEKRMWKVEIDGHEKGMNRAFREVLDILTKLIK